jgi:antitoxin (DNA-binding transcriptional repressor) of toxin-antitoxin stability system
MGSRSRTPRRLRPPSTRLSHMTKSVGVHEAKTHLSRLLKDVEAGEEVVITSRGKAVATLGPPPHDQEKRVFGIDEGRFVVPDDFNDPMPDEWLDELEN